MNDSKTLRRIRDARTVKELSSIIDPLIKDVSSISVESKAITSISAEIELGGMVVRPVRTATDARYDNVVDLSDVDLNSVEGRAKAAQQMAILNRIVSELNVAYQVLRSPAFSSFKAAKSASDALAKVIQEARAKHSKLVKAAAAPSTEVPKEHVQRARSIANYMKKVIPENSRGAVLVAHYIANKVGPVANYQSFITVKDFTSNEGYTYPNYVIVLTSSVNTNTGETKTFITSQQELKAPGSFPYGSAVTSPSQLKSSINRLLALDGSPFMGDRVPVGRTTAQMRAATALGLKLHVIDGKSREVIDGVRVSNNKIYVRLVAGMDAKERTEAVNEVVSIVSSMYGSIGKAANKNAVTYRMIRGNSKREWMEFTVLPSRGSKTGKMTLERINEVATLLGLDETQKRQIIAAVK